MTLGRILPHLQCSLAPKYDIYIYISTADINRTYHENFKQKSTATQQRSLHSGGEYVDPLFSRHFLVLLSINFFLLQFAKMDTKTSSYASLLTNCYWTQFYFREDYKQIVILPDSPSSMISWPVVMWQPPLTAPARRWDSSGSRFSNHALIFSLSIHWLRSPQRGGGGDRKIRVPFTTWKSPSAEQSY